MKATLLGVGIVRSLGVMIQLALTVVVAASASTDIAGTFFFLLVAIQLVAVLGRLGIEVALVKQLAPLIEASEFDAAWRRTVAAQLLVLVAVGIVANVSVAVANIVELPLLVAGDVGRLALAACGTAAVLQGLTWAGAGALRASGRAGLAAVCELLIAPCGVLVAAGLAVGAPSIDVFVFGLLAGQSVALVAAFGFIALIWRRPPVVPLLTDFQAVASTNWGAYSVVICGVLVVQLPLLITGVLGDAEATAVLHVAIRIASLVGFPLVVANSVVGARFAATLAEGDWPRAQSVLNEATLLVSLAAGAGLATIWFASGYVLGYMGAEYAVAELPMMVIALAYFFSCVAGPVGYALLMGGKDGAALTGALAGVVVVAIVALLAVPNMGALGAAGAILGGFLVSNVVNSYLMHREMGLESALLFAIRGSKA